MSNIKKIILFIIFISLLSYAKTIFAYSLYNNDDIIKFKSSSSYNGKEVLLRANLYKPKHKGKNPTVILMHGCGGWQPAVKSSLISLAKKLTKNGFVVFNLDSFGPRRNSGGKVCSSFRMLKDARKYRENDVKDAIKYLKNKEFVDTENIFLIGQSNGGSVAMNLANIKKTGLKAIAAYYPWCGALNKNVNLESPLLILGGDKDNWVSPERCKKILSKGKEINIVTYPNSAHSFDIKVPKQKYMGKYYIGYNKIDTEDSRRRIISFFNKYKI